MEANYPSCNPEIWGGIECTINRMADVYRDQLAEAGHYSRKGDIEAITKLGIRKLRYPVLWEKHLPDENGKIDWVWIEDTLQYLRRTNVVPIVGLVHHGSGPTYTDLLDAQFADKLADYAGQVAEQFPWLEFYTPVNEPLTTARFSGLYGHWYPHRCSERSFIQMMLNQVKGIILSMQAIRRINPAAKLVQTEDLCRVHSAPELQYQAVFENERRWLTYDLLCGKFRAGHFFWNHFISLGIPEAELAFFAANPCPPDIMGLNYYITSERYLDEKLENYPSHLHGGNGRHSYVDTDAARMDCRSGLETLITEAWERYHLPMAITECHLNCGREDQMRWLKEIWDTCTRLNRNGIPVKAVTVWSLLGSYDWNSLLLQQNGHYESGAFDISSGYLRPTILVKMIRAYAYGKSFDHPVLQAPGWWHRQEQHNSGGKAVKPLLIVSHDIRESEAFMAICDARRIAFCRFSPDEWAQHNKTPVSGCTRAHSPWGIVILSGAGRQNCDLIERAAAYCREHRLSMTLVITAVSHEDNAGPLMPEDCLLVQPGNIDGTMYLHQLLDLLIDGEKGHWVTGEHSARLINLQEPALV